MYHVFLIPWLVLYRRLACCRTASYLLFAALDSHCFFLENCLLDEYAVQENQQGYFQGKTAVCMFLVFRRSFNMRNVIFTKGWLFLTIIKFIFKRYLTKSKEDILMYFFLWIWGYFLVWVLIVFGLKNFKSYYYYYLVTVEGLKNYYFLKCKD